MQEDECEESPANGAERHAVSDSEIQEALRSLTDGNLTTRDCLQGIHAIRGALMRLRPGDRADGMQEAICRLLDAKSRGMEIRNSSGWLAGAIRNIRLESWKASKRLPHRPQAMDHEIASSLVDRHPSIEQELASREEVQRLLTALIRSLKKMTEVQREIEMRKHYDHQSEQEIAEYLSQKHGVTLKTAFRWIAASHARLATRVAKEREEGRG